MDGFTKALLHFNGLDTSTTFTDESGKTWTGAGNAQLDTAQKKFGTASLLLDGTGDYISTPDHNDFYFVSGDFTIDFWIRFNTVPSTGEGAMFYGQGAIDFSHFIDFFLSEGTQVYFNIYPTSPGVSFSWNWTPSINTWYHVALVRSGSSLMLFIDGQRIGSPQTISVEIPDLSEDIQIGSFANIFYVNGWIDEFRISKGIARWTSNFTPDSGEYSTTTSTSTTSTSSSTSTTSTSSSTTSTSSSTTSTSSSTTSTSSSTSLTTSSSTSVTMTIPFHFNVESVFQK